MPDSYSFYRVRGKKIPLTPVPSARLVEPRRGTHPAVLVSGFERAGLMLDRATPRHRLLFRGDADRLEEVMGSPEVWASRGVFSDPSGLELVLTNELMVGFAPEVGFERKYKTCAAMGLVPADMQGDLWRARVRDPDPSAPLAIAEALQGAPEVRFAEPNMLQAPCLASVAPPSDPFFPNQWHLDNTGQFDGKPGADLRALQAWEFGYGSANVSVVIHDTGIDAGHPDLLGNLNRGWDFSDGDADATPVPFFPKAAHGTACAGLVAAMRDGVGVVGIAPGCRITPLRIQTLVSWDTMAQSIRWAAKHGDIICCAWSFSESTLVADAIREVSTSGRNGLGTPMFCAVQNSGIGTVEFPASLPETIGVGASTNRDIRAGYSNFGPGLDLLAPSNGNTVGIETTDMVGLAGFSEDGDYCKANDSTNFGGTSAATALAAGVAALLLSFRPDLPLRDLRAALRDSAEKIDPERAKYGTNGWSAQYGYGRIDAARALRTIA